VTRFDFAHSEEIIIVDRENIFNSQLCMIMFVRIKGEIHFLQQFKRNTIVKSKILIVM
jgi:hypothetical protein